LPAVILSLVFLKCVVLLKQLRL